MTPLDRIATYSSVRRILAAGASFYAVGDQCDPATSEGAGLYAEGLPPLGYARRSRPGVRDPMKNALVIVERDAAKVRAIFAACISGASIPAIAERVGISRHVVQAVLRCRAYLAEPPAQWPPPILDAATWARAREALAARRLGGARPRGHELAADEPSSPRPIADVAGTRAKLARRRARYLELAASDLMTDDELRAALTRVDDELRGLAEAPRGGPERRAIARELAVSVAVAPGVAAPAWRS